jgi:HlyD family secretion protein
MDHRIETSGGATTLPPPAAEPARPTAATPDRPPALARARWPRPGRRARWALAGLAAAVLLGVALRPAPVAVELGLVTRGPLEAGIDADGVTRVVERHRLAAPVTGRLERLAVREGDAVREGEVVARIAPLPLDTRARAEASARADAAAAALQEGEARVAQAAAHREQAERTAARMRAVAAEGAVSVEALERAQLAARSAARDHEAAISRTRAAAAELDAARAALAPAAAARAAVLLRAPIAGRVLRLLEPDERVVTAGTPVVELGDAARLEIVADVLSADAVRVAPGAPVRVTEWGGDDALEGRVLRVEPSGFTRRSALGVEEQRVNVLISLDAPPAALGDGYRVGVRLVTWRADAVVRVPLAAVLRDGDGWAVFVADGGRAVHRRVELGRRGTAEAEVLAGLEPGEHVIVFPSDLVHDGVRVRPDDG